jgi:hypothetical protein
MYMVIKLEYFVLSHVTLICESNSFALIANGGYMQEESTKPTI